MADFDSSLPIRTETDGDVVVKIGDGTTASQYWAIDSSGRGLVTVEDASGNTIVINADGSLSSVITDGTDTLGINADGSINVIVQDEGVVSGEVHEYGTVSAGVPGTENTVVDYTVTALKTLKIKSVQAAASGKFKAELQIGPAASEVTVVTFFGSTANGSVNIPFPANLEVAAGDKVLVVITNNDKANADVYAFFNGVEV